MSDLEPSYEYSVIRDETHAEYNLMGNRLTWYVTSQSFLVSAFAISSGSTFLWFHWFSSILLPMIGFLASAFTFPSIAGSLATLRLWHEKQAEFFLRHPEFTLAFHLVRPNWIETRGLLFPKMMPLLFGSLWLIVFVASRFRH